MFVSSHKIRSFVAICLLLAGCSAAEAENGASGAVCPPDSTLTYDSFGRAFMQSYCVRCHASTLEGSARNGAPSDHNFDTLAGIQATEREHLDAEAAAGPDRVNVSMPPSAPSPSVIERRELGEWVACGTP